MLNYIRSEIYKTLHRKYFFGLLIICGVLGLGVNLLLMWMNKTGVANGADTAFSLTMLGNMALAASYVCPMIITDIVFGEEYKHQTLKNTVSYGFSRTQIFFGKFLAEVPIAVVSVAVIFGMFTLGAFLLGSTDVDRTAQAFQLYLQKLFLMFPLWLWSLALAHTIVFFVKNNTFFAFAAVGILYFIPLIFNQYLVYPWPDFVTAVSPYLAFTKMQVLTSDRFVIGNLGLAALEYWGAGLIRLAAVLGLGVALFRRKEIK